MWPGTAAGLHKREQLQSSFTIIPPDLLTAAHIQLISSVKSNSQADCSKVTNPQADTVHLALKHNLSV